MNILFWQNCVSPHQLPYIKELHNDEIKELIGFLKQTLEGGNNEQSKLE